MSPKSTSAPSPSEMSFEKPMPRDLAQSSTVVTSAPDCETKAILPGSASVCAKLAFRPSRARALRRSWARGCAADRASLRPASRPSATCRERRLRRQPAASGRWRRACRARQAVRSASEPPAGGVQTIGKLRCVGKCRDRRIDGKAIELAMFRIDQPQLSSETARPEVPKDGRADALWARADAPIKATERGANSDSRLRMLMKDPGRAFDRPGAGVLTGERAFAA